MNLQACKNGLKDAIIEYEKADAVMFGFIRNIMGALLESICWNDCNKEFPLTIGKCKIFDIDWEYQHYQHFLRVCYDKKEEGIKFTIYLIPDYDKILLRKDLTKAERNYVNECKTLIGFSSGFDYMNYHSGSNTKIIEKLRKIEWRLHDLKNKLNTFTEITYTFSIDDIIEDGFEIKPLRLPGNGNVFFNTTNKYV